MRCWSVVMVFAIGLTSRGPAFAVDPRFPDWPCNQVKVPELSIAAMWAGPSVDDVGATWQGEPMTKDLVARLAARRTPLDEAEKAIADFVSGDAATRERKAKLIFAGLFDTLNGQRNEVMSGIERLFRQQRTFADHIRTETRELQDLQDAPDHDQSKVDGLIDRVGWDTRLFDERRTTIRYACEVPVLIEQRVFALARAIQQALE
jgi:hypothetical protein